MAAVNDRKLDRANWDSFSWNSDVDVVRLAHVGRVAGARGLRKGAKWYVASPLPSRGLGSELGWAHLKALDGHFPDLF